MLMLNVEVIPGTIGPHSHKPRVPHRPPATHKFFFCIILSTHVTGVLTLGTCAQRRVRKAEKFLWMWCLMSVSVWSDSQCLSVDCVVCACGVCSMVIDRVYSLWCLMPDARALSGAVKAFLWLWCREKKSTCIPEKNPVSPVSPNKKILYHLYPGFFVLPVSRPKLGSESSAAPVMRERRTSVKKRLKIVRKVSKNKKNTCHGPTTGPKSLSRRQSAQNLWEYS